ncbi:hypothetical protein [Hoylesella timonensis]|uniref:hypothetical protein n=1 Tax=Hoylesella timonensis TaxID=386414 RepID=UPI002432E52A|nr:hypothetical protein [Hoylesella timonensis]
MKKILLFIALVIAFLGTANAKENMRDMFLFAGDATSMAGEYSGKITYADMNGKNVTHKFNKEVTFGIVNKGNGVYAIHAYLDFWGGPAHHTIDLTKELTTFTLDANGNIVSNGVGGGHIKVTVGILPFMDRDFNVQPLTGSIVNRRLNLRMVCHVMGKNYTATFDFSGKK